MLSSSVGIFTCLCFEPFCSGAWFDVTGLWRSGSCFLRISRFQIPDSFKLSSLVISLQFFCISTASLYRHGSQNLLSLTRTLVLLISMAYLVAFFHCHSSGDTYASSSSHFVQCILCLMYMKYWTHLNLEVHHSCSSPWKKLTLSSLWYLLIFQSVHQSVSWLVS